MGKSVENANEGKGLYSETPEQSLNAARDVSEREPKYAHRELTDRVPQHIYEVLQNQVDALNQLNQNNQLQEATTVFEVGKTRFGKEVFVNPRLKRFRKKKGRR